ncbi:MAG TPA: MOSC N-terminal beta barrel domain-containing protein [Saprospiraceae bacterium]|nr:MOSC N-terminal beta barrel domain-containing protein [Saprospiraceae bacterium]HMQ85318.1 MOSC N-terminal beta barrel domain-containing protein [Saprospiraceae bacterium]
MYPIHSLHIYPIKSLAGISLGSAKMEKRGLQHDRRWMLVDKDGVFLTQRQYRQMTQLQPEISEDGLLVRHLSQKAEHLWIPFEAEGANMQVQIWRGNCMAKAVSTEADAWFSEQLGLDCRLVHMPPESIRPLSSSYGRVGELVSFADSCPLLLIGLESLGDLNSRLPEPISMNRFRPNIVLSGVPAFEEETWKSFKINAWNFRGIRACPRCAMVNTRQEDGQIVGDPLGTLATYRKEGHKVLFGLHALWQPGLGDYESPVIRVGMELEL